MYKLIAHLPTGKEVIEEVETMKEARFLQTEYIMAYNCHVSIKLK